MKSSKRLFKILKLKFPPIGMRTVKSIIATTLTVIIIYPFGESIAFYAAVASAISLQATLTDSYEMGLQRIFATLLGTLFGIAGYSIFHTFIPSYYFMIIIYFLGVSITIYFCQVLNFKKGVVSAIVGFSAMLLTVPTTGGNEYDYIIRTLIGNMFGVIVGIIINTLLFPPSRNRELFTRVNKLIDEVVIISKRFIFSDVSTKSDIYLIKNYTKGINDILKLHIKEKSKKFMRQSHISEKKLTEIIDIVDDCIYSLYHILVLSEKCNISYDNLLVSKEIFGLLPPCYEEMLKNKDTITEKNKENIVFNYHLEELLNSIKILLTINTTHMIKLHK